MGCTIRKEMLLDVCLSGSVAEAVPDGIHGQLVVQEEVLPKYRGRNLCHNEGPQ